MTAPVTAPDAAFRLSETWPAARLRQDVDEQEYLRLLGYPPGHTPGEQVKELAAGVRRWYGTHGRPWLHVREVELGGGTPTLRLEQRALSSTRLEGHLRRTGAVRALVVAVSAGPECEQHARQLWQAGKPDEYFFHEIFGSAVVEHLLAAAHHRICALAEGAGLVAVPPFSPGHSGWSVGEQNALHALLGGGAALPGPLGVLASGMLNPKKSQLAVIALGPRTPANLAAADQVPCQRCAWPNCRYRRAGYQPVAAGASATLRPGASAPAAVRYTVNVRALEKWAAERLECSLRSDGTVDAVFRFDGTTCSNLGRPFTFAYRASFATGSGEPVLVGAQCAPVDGDRGHRSTCAYLADATQLERALAAETPTPGRTLSELIEAEPGHVVSGCLCGAGQRAHKWRLALETMHFAFSRGAAALSTLNPASHDQAL
jgi:hypothetical protein